MSHLLFFHQSTENVSTIHTANEYCTLTKCFHNVRVLPGQNVCCFWVSKRIYKSCLQEFVAFPMTLSNSVLLWALNNNRTGHSTGKSLSESLIFASTNPQYDNRLFIEFTISIHENSKLQPGKNILCTEIVSDIQNNFCTQHVLPMFLKKKSFWQRFTCTNHKL